MANNNQNQELFSKGLINVEQVKDYLNHLRKQNKSRLDSLLRDGENLELESCFSLLSLKDIAAEFIMQVCAYWKYSPDVQIVAIEIYYQFITSLLSSLFKIIFDKSLILNMNTDIETSKINMKCTKSTENYKNRKQSLEFQNGQWNKTMEHIISQMELRAITSIAIASKFLCHYSHVTLEMAIKFLAINGRKYSPDVIVKSEIRILKALNFNISSLPMPMSYIQALLDCLTEHKENIDSQEIYSLCTKILLCFYSCSHNVFKRFLELKEKMNNDWKLSLKMALLSKDMVLLSCAVISSASYLWSRKISDLVIKYLSDIADLPQESIAKLSFILLEEILH